MVVVRLRPRRRARLGLLKLALAGLASLALAVEAYAALSSLDGRAAEGLHQPLPRR